ncbi:MAG TPA: preprotein translocase subunit SecG [Gemmatimonadales bacterium]|nr:preprotein translocase subunit SecG [Gemmatimonadales bacterium]
MFYLLLTLLIIDALILSVVVLLQSGQGGGLAGFGGSGTAETVLGGRQAVTILTKATWWCGGIFLALSLLLSFVHPSMGSSALQERLRTAAPTAPAPLPGAPSSAAPAAPAPAPSGQQAEPAAPSAPSSQPAAPSPSQPKP